MANDDLLAVRPETELLRALVDNVSSMLAYWDSDCRCRFANRAYERWFGRSPQSLIGTHISELLGPLYQLNLPYIEGALRGEPQEFEREIPDPAGGPSRHSLANYVPDIVDGVVRGFFVLVTDISAIKRAELALERSEAQISKLVSVSADAIISVDASHRISMFNEGAEKIFGYSAAEMKGAPLETLIPERFRLIHRERVRRFAEGPETSRRMGARRAEFFGLRKNGEEFPLDAAISKLEIGGETLLNVSLRDISEQKRVEREEQLVAELGEILVTAGADYQRLLTDVANVIVRNLADWCSVDIAQQGDVRRIRIMHSNPAMAAICEQLERYPVRWERPSLQHDATETRGPVLMSDVSPEYLESLAQSPAHLELMRMLDPGSFIVVPLMARGQALGTLGLGASRASRRFGPQDVRVVERLASRVALAVDNARLHESLERAVRARDEVLGIVAHDLRSPLNNIVLQAQLLRRQDGPERREQKRSNRIHEAAMRMDRLIQDLLDVTRLEAGERLSIAPQVVGLDGILAAAIEQQQATLAGRDLHVDATGTPPNAWADRARLLQVLDNLLGNAIKFARRSITIGADSKDGEVRCWVSDDGPGISPKDLPHLFDRFWQATKSDRRSAGLGLSIVKGIVDAHGGRVWAESEVGVGTTVYFTLPTRQPSSALDEAGVAAQEREAPSARATNFDGGSGAGESDRDLTETRTKTAAPRRQTARNAK